MNAFPLLAILGVGALGYVMTRPASAASKGSSSGTSNPFENIPTTHKGMTLFPAKVTAKSGRSYVTHSTGPDAKDDVLVIAVMEAPGTPWLAYVANRGTSKRRLHRAFAAGDTKAARDKTVAQMMSDFGVKS